MAAVTEKWVLQGVQTTVMSTELNSAAAGSIKSASSTYTNQQGTANWDGYTWAQIQLNLASPSGAFAAGSSFALWIRQSSDSTPNGAPDFSWNISGLSGAYQETLFVPLPPGVLQFYAENIQGSGSQALASASNTVKVTPVTRQGV
jgi:hypothetical protein